MLGRWAICPPDECGSARVSTQIIGPMLESDDMRVIYGRTFGKLSISALKRCPVEGLYVETRKDSKAATAAF